jgi:hypothetical protein
VVRWRNVARTTQAVNGVTWGSELGVVKELAPTTAVAAGAGVAGLPGTGFTDDRYRAFTRMRWSSLRRWLYFEVEPEVFWARDLVGDFRQGVASTVRVEINFDGDDSTAKRRRAAAVADAVAPPERNDG